MRQTPFGVWNPDVVAVGDRRGGAPMRQTPFGVWNLTAIAPCAWKAARLQ